MVITKKNLEALSWKETFQLAVLCSENADRLYRSAILLFENNFIEQSYNSAFIACEEYFKAKTFDSISFVKSKGEYLNDTELEIFIKGQRNHVWKFDEAFLDAEMGLPNITIKTLDNFDDTEIQKSFHERMGKVFETIKAINPYVQKNNSLYVGYDNMSGEIIIPQRVIPPDITEKLLEICFHIQMHCKVGNSPKGDFSSYIKWRKE